LQPGGRRFESARLHRSELNVERMKPVVAPARTCVLVDLDGDSIQPDVRLETAKENTRGRAEGSPIVDLDHDALELRKRENVEQRRRFRRVELVVAEIDLRDTVGPRERHVVPVEEAGAIMRKTEEEVRRLAALKFLHSAWEDGELKVEPVVM
jgi:hypothetical protein